MKKKLLIALAVCAAMVSIFTVTAFADATTGSGSLEDPYVDEQGLKYATRDNVLEGGSSDELAVIGIDIDNLAENVVIPDTLEEKSVTGIDTLAFTTDIKGMLDSGMNTGSFSPNTILKSVEIPESVKDLGIRNIGDLAKDAYGDGYDSDVFAKMTAAGLVEYAGGTLNGSATSVTITTDVPGMIFGYCTKLESVTFTDESTITKIPGSMFYGCESLNNIEIPESVTEIGASAFAGIGASSVTIPKGVATIGGGLFYNCENLTEVYFMQEESTSVSITETLEDKISSHPHAMFGHTVQSPEGTNKIKIYTDNTSISEALSGKTNVAGIYKISIPEDDKTYDDQAKTIKIEAHKSVDSDVQNSYDLVIYPDDAENFVSYFADIEFKVMQKTTTGTVNMTIDSNSASNIRIAAQDGTLISDGTAYQYAFYVQPNTDGTNEGDNGTIMVPFTGLKIGTITISGYGEGQFIIYDAVANKEIADSIVDDLAVSTLSTTGGANSPQSKYTAEADETLKSASATPNYWETFSIEEKTATVECYVVFANDVEESGQDYSKMHLTVDDNMISTEPMEIDLYDGNTKLGSAGRNIYEVFYSEELSTPILEHLGFTSEDPVHGYLIRFRDMPANNHQYHMTLTGDGYRTAEITGLIDGDLQVYFWNNVMDEEHPQSNKVHTSNTNKKNFLAGDIQMDGKIGIYDLNGVTSYYGQTGMKDEDGSLAEGANETYIQYDLNRDGKIDAKDIAYVLVSWGE